MKKGKDYIGLGVGAVILNEKGEMLMMHRGPKSQNEPNCWDKPGGGVELGETREQALKREIKEEIDCEIEIIRELNTVDHIIKEENQHWVSTNFLCRITSGKPKIMEPHKCNELRWFSLSEIKNLKTTSHIPLLLDYLEKNPL